MPWLCYEHGQSADPKNEHVMKSTNRIHQNSAVKGPKSQVEIRTRAQVAKVLKKSDETPICSCAGKNGVRLVRADIQRAVQSLSEAAAQSKVLMELVENHLDQRTMYRPEVFSLERAGRFNFGLSLLGQATRDRLTNAVDGMMAAAYSKKPEVAS